MQITDYSQVDVIHSCSKPVDIDDYVWKVCLSTWNNVEKMYQTDFVKYYSKEPAMSSPYGISVDEINEIIEILNGSWDGYYKFDMTGKAYDDTGNIKSECIMSYQQLGGFYIGAYDTQLAIQQDGIVQSWITKISSGISFILKKGSGYIVYYVDKNGVPGAVDTEGVIYTSAEAMGYLKAYDSEKYAGSLERAEELGLKMQFLNMENDFSGISTSWYVGEGKTTADITLPEHRARLVGMIQALEAEL